MSKQAIQPLLFSILQYLDSLKQAGIYDEEEIESLDVGIQCVSSLASLDVQDDEDVKKYGLPHTLPVLMTAGLKELQKETKFNQFLEVVKKRGGFQEMKEGTPEYTARLAQIRAKYDAKLNGDPPPATPSPAPASIPEKKAPQPEPSETDKKRAAELKGEGNAALMAKDYENAIRLYTDAINLHPTAVYYSNRAAAKITLQRFADALPDCQTAVKLDPEYGKAHYRLGQCNLALSLGAARENLQTAAALSDPRSQQDMKKKLGAIEQALASADIRLANSSDSAPVPLSTSAAEAAPPRAAPGMPDFSSLLNNPMMQQMAESMMGEDGNINFSKIGSMMNNPAMQEMMSSIMPAMAGAFGGAQDTQEQPASPFREDGNGADAMQNPIDDTDAASQPELPPFMAGLMNDPNIAAMANDPSMAAMFSEAFGGTNDEAPEEIN
jgi:small glutamine-rich tetratricopeptide repeat-containing protein alpha